MRKLLCIICITALLNISCATIFKGTNSQIDVDSEPQGAEVVVDGFPRGNTPTTLTMESDKTYEMEIKMEGYKSAYFSIAHHVQAGWVVLDVILGLVGVVVDAVTGAWYEANEHTISVQLEPE